jgi:hypothetical protein
VLSEGGDGEKLRSIEEVGLAVRDRQWVMVGAAPRLRMDSRWVGKEGQSLDCGWTVGGRGWRGRTEGEAEEGEIRGGGGGGGGAP